MLKKNKNKEVLCIIPARQGSKSILNKNIKKFNGKPLISWTIKQALSSQIDNVIVSTDSIKIKKISENYGAKVPFLRPKKLAKSKTAIEPVIKDCLIKLEENFNYVPRYVVLLMPTSPFRTVDDINNAIKIIKKNQKITSVVSVDKVEANDNPNWMLKSHNQKLTLLNNKKLSSMPSRRQLLPKVYKRNDFVYVFKPNNIFLKKPELYGNFPKLFFGLYFSD